MIKLILILSITLLTLSAKENISLQLLWKHQFEFAGFYIAKEKGFYDDVGLDVEIKEYKFGIDILQDVISQKTDIGIGRSSLVLNKMNGSNIVLLNALYQSSPYVLVSRERKDLQTVSDFVNKKIMLSDDLKSIAAISSMMKIENIKESDYIDTPHSFNIDDLVDGKVDIMTTYLSNEPFHLKEKKIAFKVFDPKDYGFDFYADLVFTSNKYLSTNLVHINRFQNATLKGWEYAFANMDETVKLILEKYNTQNKTKEALLYEAKVLKELAYRENIDFGNIDEFRIKNIANVYRLLGLTTKSDDSLEGAVYKQNNMFEVIKKLFSFEFFIAVIVFIAFIIFLGLYKQYILKKQNEDLSQVVHNKTKQLQQMNDNLEDTIVERTKELQEQSDLMQYMANHDSLTGLPNRLLFLDRLKQSIKHAKRKNTSISVLFLDLDRFKEINDSYGHNVGDLLLQEVSKQLRLSTREEDTISRLGGDEFTLIVQDVDIDKVMKIAQKLLDSIKNRFIIEGHEIYTTFSIGISTYPEDGNTPEILLRNADTAMYSAKDHGKNQYQFYNLKMTESAVMRSKIERNLRIALESDELLVYYQPKVDASNNQLTGVEALVRWQHPEFGIIGPNQFISIAEDTGLIILVDEWMMTNSMKMMKKLHDQGLKTGKLSLNLSIKQLESEGWVERVKEILFESGMDVKYLELEITEGQIMKDPQNAIAILNRIREIGISISIDDFGTGYSSLAYLKRLPVDTLKIDRAFIKDLPHDENDVAIVRAIVALAKSLKLGLIGEGVEVKEQLTFLLENGCSNIQGYYYSKPLPENGYKDFLVKYQ